MSYEHDYDDKEFGPREDYSGARRSGSFTSGERSQYVNRYCDLHELSWDDERGQWWDDGACEHVAKELVNTTHEPADPAHGEWCWFWRVENVWMGAFDKRNDAETDAWDSLVRDIAIRERSR